MVKFRRKNIQVKYERREFPRIEYHGQVAIRGIDEMASIIDISIGGVYLEINNKHDLKADDIINLTLRLPTESEVITLKAQVVNVETSGIGCMFIDITPRLKNILENFFEFSRGMVPI